MRELIGRGDPIAVEAKPLTRAQRRKLIKDAKALLRELWREEVPMNDFDYGAMRQGWIDGALANLSRAGLTPDQVLAFKSNEAKRIFKERANSSKQKGLTVSRVE